MRCIAYIVIMRASVSACRQTFQFTYAINYLVFILQIWCAILFFFSPSLSLIRPVLFGTKKTFSIAFSLSRAHIPCARSFASLPVHIVPAFYFVDWVLCFISQLAKTCSPLLILFAFRLLLITQQYAHLYFG